MRWTCRLPNAVVDHATLNLNRRAHGVQVRAAQTAIRARVAAEARQAGLTPQAHVHAVLTFRPPDRRRRDRVNYARVHKAAIDGLVDAGVIPDDTPDHLTDTFPIIGEPHRPPFWLLEVWT